MESNFVQIDNFRAVIFSGSQFTTDVHAHTFS